MGGYRLILLVWAGIWTLHANAQPPPGATQGTVVVGVVAGYGSNPDYDIDKIRVSSGGQEMWFHFPPHTAAAVLDIAKLRATVRITMRPGPGGRGGELASIYGGAQKKSADIQSIPPPPPEAGVNVLCRGIITGLETDAGGAVAAFIVDTSLILLPPHIRGSIAPLLKLHAAVEVSGVQRNTGSGFVNIRGMGVIRPDTLKIGNIYYLVR